MGAINLYARKDWTRELSPLEIFFLRMYPMATLKYCGTIEEKRFVTALEKALHHFPCIFGQIRSLDVGFEVVSRSGDSFVTCEVEHLSLKIDELPAKKTLPQKIDERINSGVIDSVEGLPMAYFKLTIAKDGFTFSYCINHAFFDQASILCLMQLISDCYNDDDFSLNKVYEPFVPATLTLPASVDKANLSELRDKAHRFGWLYMPQFIMPKISDEKQSAAVRIILNHETVTTIKNLASERVSTNDIINGVLQKVFAMNICRDELSKFAFGFACNMRTFCGFADDAIGNIGVFSLQNELSISEINSRSIDELAVINRHYVRSLQGRNFNHFIDWLNSLALGGEELKNYVSKSLVDPNMLGVSNWASFEYGEIHFSGQVPFTLDFPPLPAPLTFPIVTFRKRPDDNKEYILVFNTSALKCRLDDVKALAKKLDLELEVASCRQNL